jgi:23S rRNA (adenine2030-N6)-methyltransferase
LDFLRELRASAISALNPTDQMLSYRHGYHAGNVGDVLKHAVVALLIEALKKKAGPFAYLETHAGAGRYDLAAAQAEKTGEYREGIGLVWGRGDAPEALAPYLSAVAALNSPGETLRYYPGSPRVARHLLRAQDRIVLMELHGSEYPVLKQEFAGDKQVAVHHRDGYEGLKALLPPAEKRGLVVIDPSYEVKSEYAQVIEAVQSAHKRFPAGIVAVWYPVLARELTDSFKESFRTSGLRNILDVELTTRPEDSVGMRGSGMLVLNPPWQFDSAMEALAPWLRAVLDPGQVGSGGVEWLVPE